LPHFPPLRHATSSEMRALAYSTKICGLRASVLWNVHAKNAGILR
jgi:hypothetical protein